MGLIGDWMKAKNMKDPVKGTLQVTASTYPPDSATSGNFSINGIVTAPGISPTAVEHAGIAKTRKWPHNGQTLPVTVDREDPTRLKIEWDEVADSWDTARTSAEALAAQMRGDGGASVPGVPMGLTNQVIDATGVAGLREEVLKVAMTGGSPDQIMAALREHGINVPDGAAINVVDSQNGMAAFAGMFGATGAAEEDPGERLKKLQELKSQGLITDAEYETKRAQVLGDL